MTKSLEIKPIATVVGGRTEPTDDRWTGTAIIRLNPEFPVEVVRVWRSSPTCWSSGTFTRRHPAMLLSTLAVPATIPSGRPPERSSTATTAGRTSSPSPFLGC